MDISQGNSNLKVLNKNYFAGAQTLIGLFLENNELQNLTEHNFNNTPNLKYLFLSNNSIDSIEDYAFDGLSGLLELKLDRNKLQIVREKTFYGLINLRLLNLAHNYIKIIHLNSFIDMIVKKLNLYKNECIDINFSDFKKVADGKIVYGMCRYYDKKLELKEHLILVQKVYKLELKIRRIEINKAHTEAICQREKDRCENYIK